jgi:hypothetical protein
MASTTAFAAAAVGLWTGLGGASAHAASAVPSPDHVVVVVLENHAYSQVIGSSKAPYINSLVSGGANLTQSYAETHPSQPNYYAMFSGDTQGVTDDSCVTPGFSSAANLASEVIAAGRTWASYNEDLPSQGDLVQQRRLRPEAQPLVRVQQHPDGQRHDVRPVPDGLHTAPADVVRHPQPVQRHARLLGVHR